MCYMITGLLPILPHRWYPAFGAERLTEANGAYFFLSLCSVTSSWRLAMGHGGRIDTMELGKCSSSCLGTRWGRWINLYPQTTASTSHWNVRLCLVRWLYLGYQNYTWHAVGAQ